MKLSSDDLLDRLKKKGTRDPTYTKELIIGKLNDNDADVATTSLKVTVSCPLGKMRMRVSLFTTHINKQLSFVYFAHLSNEDLRIQNVKSLMLELIYVWVIEQKRFIF